MMNKENVFVLIIHQEDGGSEVQGVFATETAATKRRAEIRELLKNKRTGWPKNEDFTVENYNVED